VRPLVVRSRGVELTAHRRPVHGSARYAGVVRANGPLSHASPAPMAPFRMRPFRMRVDGAKCVFPRDVIFPDVCLKCAATQPLVRRRKSYKAQEGGVAVLIASAFFAAPMRLVGTPRKPVVTLVLDLPLCIACNARHRTAYAIMFVGWGILAACFVVAFFAKPFGFAALAGVAAVVWFAGLPIVGIVHLAYASRRLVPGLVRIDETTITLARLGPAAVKKLSLLAT
jgi:hypothetical protein